MARKTASRVKGPGSRFGLKNYEYPDRFGDWLGYRVTRVDRKRNVAEAELEIREDHLSPARKMHGGVISAFFDYACGAAVFSTMESDDYASTVELKVNYFRPILLGDRLRARTEVVFRGKRICVVHGFIHRNREKDPAAMATATFNVVASARS